MTTQITPNQWSNLQIMQSKAKAFLSAATGAAAKSNLTAFQSAFNTAFDAIVISVGESGGDPQAPARMLGTTRIAIDGLWGPESAIAMAICIWLSFPGNVWAKAAGELATANVLNKVSGAQPISRNVIASTWYPKWKAQVADMVWKDYAGAVVGQPKPEVTQANNNTTLENAQSNQQNVINKIDEAEGQSPALTSTQIAIPGEPVLVPGTAPIAKSLTWLWVTLGLAGVGGGLWWAFGRKSR